MENKVNESVEELTSKGTLRFREYKRLLFLGIPWPFVHYEVYDQDIVIVSGFLNIREDDCYLYRVNDVHLNASFLQRILGLSTLTLYTSDVTTRTIVFKNIRHGHEIKDFILSNSEKCRLRRRTVSMQNISFGTQDLHDVDDADLDDMP